MTDIKKDQRILILGGSGFVGYHIFKLLNSKFEVYGSFLTNSKVIDKYNEQFFKINILNYAEMHKIIKKLMPHYVINCIAISSARKAEKMQNLAYQVNVKGTENIVKICRETGAKLIHFSTDNVFDGKKKANEYYTELDTPNPINFYGKSKLLSEKIALKIDDSIVLRSSLVYGNVFTDQHKNFVYEIIEKCNNNERIYAYFDQYRTPISVLDIARLIKEIIINKKRDLYGIYNIAGPEPLSRYEIAIKTCEIFGLNLNLIEKTFCNDPIMPRNLLLDPSRISNSINFKFINFKKGLLEIQEHGLKK
ncbi:MAG: SDR family oxidoreductase [Candidatus Helarchaeota archaeon]